MKQEEYHAQGFHHWWDVLIDLNAWKTLEALAKEFNTHPEHVATAILDVLPLLDPETRFKVVQSAMNVERLRAREVADATERVLFPPGDGS